MRSHPYTPPPPLPPLLDDLAGELSSILPNHDARPRRRSSISDIPLSDLDPDTSCLLAPPPASRRRHHHVRVQGRLALVRSVSTANLHPPTTAGGTLTGTRPPVPPVPRFESAVGSTVALSKKRGAKSRRGQRRRWSLDDDLRDEETGTESEDPEAERETVIRDTQLRGYGIGGVGNIRRPIDVVHFPPSKRMNSMLLFSSVAPPSPTFSTSPDRKRWNLREIFGLDRRGKRKPGP